MNFSNIIKCLNRMIDKMKIYNLKARAHNKLELVFHILKLNTVIETLLFLLNINEHKFYSMMQCESDNNRLN